MSKRSLFTFALFLATPCLTLIGVSGCRPAAEAPEVQPDTETTTASPTVSSVPLRILSVAGTNTDEKLTAAWLAMSEQPIEFRSMTAKELVAQARNTDVIIADYTLMGDLQAVEALAPFPESMTDGAPFSRETILDGLVQQNSAWGNRLYGFPLSATLPAVWLAEDSLQAPLYWTDYQSLLQTLPQGRAAEPLADGWAVYAFLNRASAITGSGWLFETQNFTPVLNSPPYLRALTELCEARKAYPKERLSPQQIWEQLGEATLDIAVTWPPEELNESQVNIGTRLRMSPRPKGKEIYISDWRAAENVSPTAMLAPPGYFVAISTGCRQTSVARNFVHWFASGEGHYQYRRAIGGLPAVRVASAEAEEQERIGQTLTLEGGLGQYRSWFVETMEKGELRPSLRLRGSHEYLAVLDAAVIRAVEGEQSPEDALRQASEQWQEITTKLGMKTQLNSWRQSQGMRGR